MNNPTADIHLSTLLAVSRSRIVFHDGCGVHVQGWAWSSGSDMSEFIQERCNELRWAGLINVGVAEFCGNKVTVTPFGGDALWRWAQVRGVA